MEQELELSTSFAMPRNLDMHAGEMTDNERAQIAAVEVGQYLNNLKKNVIFEVIIRSLSSLLAQIPPEERNICLAEVQKMFLIVGNKVFESPKEFNEHLLEQYKLLNPDEVVIEEPTEVIES